MLAGSPRTLAISSTTGMPEESRLRLPVEFVKMVEEAQAATYPCAL